MIHNSIQVSAIVAVGKNGEMGKGDALPWKIPEDAKFYRDKTRGHANIMGRKTYEGLCGDFHGPPPKRINIVITREEDYDPQEMIRKYAEDIKKSKFPERVAYSFTDAKEAIEFAKKEELKMREEQKDGIEPEVMIVGGSQIFKLCMPYTTRLYITKIDAEFPEADVFAPDFSGFTKVVDSRKSSDENFNYEFLTLEKD